MFGFGKSKSDFDKLKKEFSEGCLGQHISFAEHKKSFHKLKQVAFCTSDERIGKLYFIFNQIVAEGESGESIGTKEEEYDFYFYFVENWAGNCLALCEYHTEKDKNYLILQFLNFDDNSYVEDVYEILSTPYRSSLVEPTSNIHKKICKKIPIIKDWYSKRKNQEWNEKKVLYLRALCDKMRPGIMTKNLAEI